MKIFTLQSVIAFVIAFLLLLEHVYGSSSPYRRFRADDSEEDDGGSEESNEDDAATATKTPAVDPNKASDLVKVTPEQILQYQQHQILSTQAYQPYLEDPWYFYKWPGVGQAEGVVGRWPWWPPAVPVKDLTEDADKKKKKEEDAEDDEDDDEDEEQDDLGHSGHSKKGRGKKGHHNDDDDGYVHTHKGKYFKQKPTGVSSVGIGTAKGKLTPWGVLYPEVNSRSDLNLASEDSEEVEDDGPSPNWRRTLITARHSSRSRDDFIEDSSSSREEAYPPVWRRLSRPYQNGYGRHNYQYVEVK